MFRDGWAWTSVARLEQEHEWDENPFRCLHTCFLRRSSRDAPGRRARAPEHRRGEHLSAGLPRRDRPCPPPGRRQAGGAVEAREVPARPGRDEGRRALPARPSSSRCGAVPGGSSTSSPAPPGGAAGGRSAGARARARPRGGARGWPRTAPAPPACTPGARRRARSRPARGHGRARRRTRRGRAHGRAQFEYTRSTEPSASSSRLKSADADELVLRPRVQVDAVRVAEAELAEHLDLGALARPQAEDDGIARDELDQVAEAAVEARPRLGHGRVREAVAEPKDLVELLPLVVDVLVVRVVLAVDEPLGVRRQQALGVVVLLAHRMLVPLVHVPGVRVAPERAVVAEAARRPR